MEEAIWFYVGIILALIGLALVVSVVVMGSEAAKIELAKNTSKDLVFQCNNVCNSDVGTVLGIKTEIASGTILSSNQNAICTTFKEKKDCRRCDCEVLGFDRKPFELNLATVEALQMFDTHNYNCTFEKDVNAVILQCKG